MSRALSVAALLGALALTGGGRAVAQELEPPAPRQGYFLSLGLYGASTVAHEKGAWVGPWAGGGGSIRLGELITRRFGLGLTIEGGRTAGDGQKSTVLALGAEGSVVLTGNLALRGGVGIGSISLHDPNDPFESSTRGVTGARFAAGISYDWFVKKKRLSGGFAITPSVQVRYVPGGDTYGFYTLVGVELTYWTGLPPRQLALPASEAWRK
jgi:hypothetical protein